MMIKIQVIKKSFFEIVFSTVIKVNEEIKEKKDIEKIILCDVQKRNLSKYRDLIFKFTS